MSETKSFAVIPAAGRSVRMGKAKLTLPWGSQTVIQEVLQRWHTSGIDAVVVVVHPQNQRLAALCRDAKAMVVTPSVPPIDMKASVSHGLDYIRQRFSPMAGDAWLLAPADMPWIEPEVIRQLIAQYRRSSSSIIAPTYQNRRGHPVLFSWQLAAKVSHLLPDEGVRSLSRDVLVEEIAWPRDTILGDLDTVEDYRQFHDRYHPASP